MGRVKEKPQQPLAEIRQTLVALQETSWIALDTLRSHKLRTFLTLLGVMLAVTTLVAVMSVLNGLNLYVADKVANLGSNAFVIDRVGIATNLDQWNKARKRPPLRLDDLEALRDGMKLADRIAGLAGDHRGRALWKRPKRGRQDNRRDARVRRDSRHRCRKWPAAYLDG